MFKNFFKNDAGVAAILFAFSVPMIIGAAGVGVDLAKAYTTKNKLEKTLDAAALAGAATNYQGTQLDTFVINYINANFNPNPSESINIGDIDIVHNEINRSVAVSGSATSQNTFMRYFNNDELVVSAQAVARKKLSGIEVALVLDNSESMQKDNRIGALRTAARDFVDTLYDTAEATDGEFKIGIVPYGLHVNVGQYGLDNDFINNPRNLQYTNSRNQQEDHPNLGWSGCVYEYDLYRHLEHEPRWDMYLYCHTPDGVRSDAGGTHCRTTDRVQVEWRSGGYRWDPEPTYENYDCPRTVDGVEIMQPNGCRRQTSPGRLVQYSEPYGQDRFEDRPRTVNVHNTCPRAIVQPLLENSSPGSRGRLESSIAGLQADGISTQSGMGMAWGLQLLSPESPYTEGAEWNSSKWSKAIVFMTDGEITTHHRGPYYNLESNDNRRNQREEEIFSTMCTRAKSQGIIVYTVQFGDDGNEALLRSCATDSEKSYEASNGADLREVFTRIAEDLGNIYLAE